MWEFWLTLGVVVLIPIIFYVCLIENSKSQKQAEEDFIAFIEERERVKNG